MKTTTNKYTQNHKENKIKEHLMKTDQEKTSQYHVKTANLHTTNEKSSYWQTLHDKEVTSYWQKIHDKQVSSYLQTIHDKEVSSGWDACHASQIASHQRRATPRICFCIQTYPYSGHQCTTQPSHCRPTWCPQNQQYSPPTSRCPLRAAPAFQIRNIAELCTAPEHQIPVPANETQTSESAWRYQSISKKCTAPVHLIPDLETKYEEKAWRDQISAVLCTTPAPSLTVCELNRQNEQARWDLCIWFPAWAKMRRNQPSHSLPVRDVWFTKSNLDISTHIHFLYVMSNSVEQEQSRFSWHHQFITHFHHISQDTKINTSILDSSRTDPHDLLLDDTTPMIRLHSTE